MRLLNRAVASASRRLQRPELLAAVNPVARQAQREEVGMSAVLACALGGDGTAYFGDPVAGAPWMNLSSTTATFAGAVKPGGLLVLELGFNSLSAVEPLLDPGEWTNVSVTDDLAGIPRVLSAERLSSSDLR